jgi:hypothetical protein
MSFAQFSIGVLDVFVPDPDAEAELSTGTRSSRDFFDVAEFPAG